MSTKEEILISSILDKKFTSAIFFKTGDREVSYIIPTKYCHYLPFIYKYSTIIYKLKYDGYW